jgi:two-component system, OmpR family, response regulator
VSHVLAVDDEVSVRNLISEYLTENGYRVTPVASGHEMERVLASDAVDIVLLDVKLPGEDGFSLARGIRRHSNVPIIMLTGQGHEVDRVLGLELGADDYLVKPFSPRELLARIKAVLRRYEGRPAESGGVGGNQGGDQVGNQGGNESVRRESELRTYRFAGWELSTGSRRLVSPTGDRIELTNGEYALLISFLKSPARVLSRDQLLEGSRLHDDIYDRSIDVQILRLRRKIEADPNEPKLIRTERGAGYFFDAAVVVV